MKITSLIKALGFISLVFVAAYSLADNVYRTLPIDGCVSAAQHGNCSIGKYLSPAQSPFVALDPLHDPFRDEINYCDGAFCEIDYILKKHHNSGGWFQIIGGTTATHHQPFRVADAQPAFCFTKTNVEIQQAIFKLDLPIEQLPIPIDNKSIAWLDQHDHQLFRVANYPAWSIAI